MSIQHTPSASNTTAVQRGAHAAPGRSDRSGLGTTSAFQGFASLLSDATEVTDTPSALIEAEELSGQRSSLLPAQQDDPVNARPMPDILSPLAQPVAPPATPSTVATLPAIPVARSTPADASAPVSAANGLKSGLATPVQAPWVDTAPSAATTTRLNATPLAPSTPANAPVPTSVASDVKTGLETPAQPTLRGAASTAAPSTDPAPVVAEQAPPVVGAPASMPAVSVRELLQRMAPSASEARTSLAPASGLGAGAGPVDPARATVASPLSLRPASLSSANPASPAPPARATVDMAPAQPGAPTAGAPFVSTRLRPDPAQGAVAPLSATPTGANTAAQPLFTPPIQAVASSAAPVSPSVETVAAATRRPDELSAQRSTDAAITPLAPQVQAAPQTASSFGAAPQEPQTQATATLFARPAAGAARAEKLSAAAADARRSASDVSVSATATSALPATERVQDPSALQALASQAQPAEPRNSAEPAPPGLWVDSAVTPSTTAEAADGSALEVHLGAPLGDLADKLRYLSANGLSSADFSLGGLGEDAVNVRINLSGNDATVEFRSDGAETRQMLEQAMGQLETLFKNEGLVLSGVSVGSQGDPQPAVFSGASSQSQAQNQPHNPSQAHSGHPRRFGQGDVSEAIAAPPQRQAAGRLDVFA